MKPIRIAFSGSGFKFPAHVGALCAVQDAGYSPVEYAGTSGGSIVAVMAACGLTLDWMRSVTMTRDWSDMLTFSPLSLVAGRGWCNGDALLAWLTEQTKGKTFADLAVDLTIMSSSINAGAPFKWSREETLNAPVALAARASASIPIVYAPVEYQGVTMEDGGMCNNVPVMKLKIDEVPRLGVELQSKTAVLPAGDIGFLDLRMRELELMLAANESTQVLMGLASGATFAYVETGYASGLDRNMSSDLRQRLFDDGYAATKAALTKMESAAALT